MPLDALQRREPRADARGLHRSRQRALFGDREQQVGLDTNDERLLDLRAHEYQVMLAVHVQIEAIHRARQI